MPRIRKKTSNRASTNDRAKVRHKVKETKKKKAKAAKKNPQWKSRKPKDPGIPNEFPYKDRILAEVAEQRRMAVDEKETRKLKKAADKANKDLNVGADGIASLSVKIVEGELKPRPRPISERAKDTERMGDEEEVPVLINRDLPTLQSVLEKADVILEVVDARDPMAFRSEHVEQLAKDAGKVLLVLNKIDTCPREALTAWARHLRTQCPTLMFRSATAFLPQGAAMLDPLVKVKAKAKLPIDDALGAQSVLDCLSQWAKEKKGEEPLIVAVVGVANVGKSSLINSLLKRAALPIYTLASSSRGPSTTEMPQEVTLEVDSQKIVLIDTPGLSFISDEDADQSTLEEFRTRDILLRSKGRIDRLKDPHPPVAHIVSRANTEDLMLLYSLPAFAKGDTTAFLSGLARANQLVKKKGELDLAGAARIVLRDWSLGKFNRYTTPPAPTVDATAAAQLSIKLANPDENITQLYSNDEGILSVIQTRKERRKQGGLVKFASGSIDPRKAAVEEPWSGLEHNDDEESDEDDQFDAEADVEGMDVDGEDEDEEKDEDEEDEGESNDEDEEDEEESNDAEMEDTQEAEEATVYDFKKFF
ncbi:P-loop containing nucleoside triphosphate hydrolase protein [Phlegmacium glaucopus]|nr:P-loop containing nucleoside triphosphate hydrolase protein [Phlegmacium glaucopus]